MPDPLLEAQVTTALNFPAQTICFLLGGLFVFIGLALASIVPAGKWKERGIVLLTSGALIAFPAVIPIMLTLIGGPSDVDIFPVWVMPSLYIVIPLVGTAIGVYGWFDSAKEKATKI